MSRTLAQWAPSVANACNTWIKMIRIVPHRRANYHITYNASQIAFNRARFRCICTRKTQMMQKKAKQHPEKICAPKHGVLLQYIIRISQIYKKEMQFINTYHPKLVLD